MAAKGNWLEWSRKLEKVACNRGARINQTGQFKATRPGKVKRDNQYITVLNEFKQNRIPHNEYVRKIVKLNRIHDPLKLPKTKTALLRRLLSDSEEE